MKFRILGPLEALDPEGEPIELGRPKQRALLAVLLIHSNRVVPVDYLMNALWAFEPPPQATNSLQSYISNLRRLLEPGRTPRGKGRLIVTTSHGYLLRSVSDDIDAGRFETLLGEAERLKSAGETEKACDQWDEALSLWRGPALADFSENSFARADAARLEEMRLSAIEARLDAQLALGRHNRVVPDLESLVLDHPFRERLWGLLMLAQYRCGRQSDALRTYRRAREALVDKLGLEPGSSLRALEAGILAQSPDLMLPAGAVSPGIAAGHSQTEPTEQTRFLGREAELELVDRTLERVLAGKPAVMVIFGEPGIGKTRLARVAQDRCTARGCRAAWGHCDQSNGSPAFWPWTQIVGAVLADLDIADVGAVVEFAPKLAQVVPEIAALLGEPPAAPTLDPEAARFRCYQGFLELFKLISARRPLAILVDDLQWADPASLELLRFLSDNLRSGPVLIVATYRTSEPERAPAFTQLLADLARSPNLEEIQLGGLGPEEVRELIRQQLGLDPEHKLVDAIQARTDGNPFFVVELLRQIGAEPGSDTGLENLSRIVPGRVRDVLRGRLARLPQETRSLLNLAAVAGREFDIAVVALAGGWDPERALTILEPALDGGLVEDGPSGDRHRFNHALIQEALYLDINALRRAHLHSRVGRAIQDLYGDADVMELAEHFYLAAPVDGIDKAFALALKAAGSAQMSLAFEAAEMHLRRAGDLADRMPASRERSLRELQVQLQLAGSISTTRGWTAPGVDQAWERASKISIELNDTDDLLAALWGSIVYSAMRGDMTAAYLWLQQLGALAPELSDRGFEVINSYCSGYRLFHSGHLLESTVGLETSWEQLSQMDTSWLIRIFNLHPGGLALAGSAGAWALLGETGKAQDRRSRALELSESIGHPFSSAVLLATLGLAEVLIGTPQSVLALADKTLNLSRRWAFSHYESYAEVLRGWAMSQLGSPEAGVAELENALGRIKASGWRLQTSYFYGLLAEARRSANRPDAALEAAEEGLRIAGDMDERFWEADLYRLRGDLILDVAPDRRADAEDSFSKGLGIARAQGAKPFGVRAECGLARLQAK